MPVAAGHRLFFYSQSGKGKKENRMEIDFLVTRPYANAMGKPRVSPIEVKSPRQYGTTSLDRFKETFGGRVGTQYVLHPNRCRLREIACAFRSTWAGACSRGVATGAALYHHLRM